MLPAIAPRLGSRGLPSNPRPRSRSTVRSRDNTPDRQSRDDYRNDRRPRSSSRPAKRPERSRSPPLPEFRPLREERSRFITRSTHKSDDSASSTTSSLSERMKLGSGYASSRTSPEEEYKDSTLWPSRKPIVEGNLYPSQDTIGTGEAIWNRVATIASNLTVSVSKAWAAHLTTSAGEETPPGQESRLTRAMKAYHLEKARDPTSLPSWLFDETERRRPMTYNAPSHDNDDGRLQSVDEMPKSRGLRDVYDAYRPETSTSNPPQRLHNDKLRPPSKATDRLKALRDAKRTVANSTAPPVTDQPKTNESDASPKTAVTQRPLARVGLPSGPRRA